MLHQLKTIIFKFRLWWKLVATAKNDFHVSFSKRIRYAFLGFSPNEYSWYGLGKNDYRNYISNYERTLSREINGKYKIVLDNKMIFEDMFSHAVNVSKSYAWISDGHVYGRNQFDVNNENVVSFLKATGIAVLKIEEGAGGRGVNVINFERDRFTVNSVEKTDNEIQKLIERQNKAFLCEYMKQSEFEDSLYPMATNTIRIIVGKKKDEYTAKILGAVQRIGNETSKPVDNVSSGALAARIDLDTGELGYAYAAKSHNAGEVLSRYERHPDTGARIKGKIIPNWNQVKDDIVSLTNKFPYLNLVAWDVLLTSSGFCIIEGNASSGMIMFQTENGMRNTEIGDLYRSYGII